jgi:two-component sensor histidine kinase/CheY-like chemotaxis protein
MGWFAMTLITTDGSAWIARHNVVPRALGALVVCLTLTVLAEWATQIDVFRTMMPGRAAMQPATAVCLLCLGLALSLARRGRRLPAMATACAAVAVVWGCATMVEHGANIDAGFDHWLFADSVARQSSPYPYPGRMSVGTALGVILCGFGLLLLAQPEAPVRRLVGSVSTTGAWLVAAIATLGHVFGVTGLHTFGAHGPVAVPTALCLLATATGTLLLAPDVGWLRQLYGTGPGAMTARILFPATGVMPVAVGWILVQGSKAGWYDADFRVALFALFQVLLLSGLLLWAASRTDLIEARRSADEAKALEQQHLLMSEVDHRAKNVLAVVQSIIRFTRTSDPAEYPAALSGRIDALAQAHTLLAQNKWSGVDLAALVRYELDAISSDAVAFRGHNVLVHADSVQSVALVLHELTVNALRHGAMSRPHGHLDVACTIEAGSSDSQDDRRAFRIVWHERSDLRLDGAPASRGFGSRLIGQIVERQLSGSARMEWLHDGLRCTLTLPDTCFAGALPDVSTPAVSLDAVPIPVAALPETAARRRILIVEDESLIAMSYEEVLSDAGYGIIGPVPDVPGALDLLRRDRPDAAVLDVNLGGQPVYPVAELLIQMGIPFVFCTGYARLDVKSEKLRHARTLTKPVSGDTLVTTVADLLRVPPSTTAARAQC